MVFLIKIFALVTVISLVCQSALAAGTDLLPMDTVLSRIDKTIKPDQKATSEPAKLLLVIIEFRKVSATMPADRAVRDWLTLWDRAQQLTTKKDITDYAAFDNEIYSSIGLRSVVASLPPPASWLALRKQAIERAKQAPADVSSLVLQFITELLLNDKPAIWKSLPSFERLANSSAPNERNIQQFTVDRMRTLLYTLFGTREQIADSFSASVDMQVKRAYGVPVDVPDLVGLIGPTKAEALLRQTLQKPISLRIPEGEATRIMARKLALSEIASLRKAQWGLVDALGTASLYEALVKRFDPGVTNTRSSKDDEESGELDYLRSEADVYYFLDMVIAGRQKDAERER